MNFEISLCYRIKQFDIGLLVNILSYRQLKSFTIIFIVANSCIVPKYQQQNSVNFELRYRNDPRREKEKKKEGREGEHIQRPDDAEFGIITVPFLDQLDYLKQSILEREKENERDGEREKEAYFIRMKIYSVKNCPY